MLNVEPNYVMDFYCDEILIGVGYNMTLDETDIAADEWLGIGNKSDKDYSCIVYAPEAFVNEEEEEDYLDYEG